jgi:hypothetical protein
VNHPGSINQSLDAAVPDKKPTGVNMPACNSLPERDAVFNEKM